MKKIALFFLLFCFFATTSYALNHEEFIEKIRQNDFDAVLTAISSGQNVNTRNVKGETALFEALKIPVLPQMVDILIAASADVNIKDNNGRTPIFYAGLVLDAIDNTPKMHIFQSLLAAGADINLKDNENKTPLIFIGAVFRGKNPRVEEEILRLLIDAGADVNAVDNEGTSPLINWINADVSCLQELLKAGANVNMGNIYGITPLLAAMLGSSDDNILFFIKSGANVNAKSKDGRTPIFFAALQGRHQILSALINAGAKINVSVEGVTPLHLAMGVGILAEQSSASQNNDFLANVSVMFPHADFLKVTQLLINAGAKIDVRTQSSPFRVFSFLNQSFNSKTPLDFARIIKNELVAAYLKGEISSIDTNIQELKQAGDDMVRKRGIPLVIIMLCGLSFGFYFGVLVTVHKSLNPVTLSVCSIVVTLSSFMLYYVHKVINPSSFIINLSFPFLIFSIYHYTLKYALTDTQSLPAGRWQQLSITFLSVFLGFFGGYICNKVLLFISTKHFFLVLSTLASFVILLIGLCLAFFALSGESQFVTNTKVWITVQCLMSSVVLQFVYNVILILISMFVLINSVSYFFTSNPETGERMSLQETLSVSGISVSVVSVTLFILWCIARWLGYSSAIFLFAIS